MLYPFACVLIFLTVEKNAYEICFFIGFIGTLNKLDDIFELIKHVHKLN